MPLPQTKDSKAPVAGIVMLRNTAVSNTNESSTTTPMKSGSFEESADEVGEDRYLAADQHVQPASGGRVWNTLVRRVVSRVLVEAACGEPTGSTFALSIAEAPFFPGSTIGGVTRRPPASSRIASERLLPASKQAAALLTSYTNQTAPSCRRLNELAATLERHGISVPVPPPD